MNLGLQTVMTSVYGDYLFWCTWANQKKVEEG